MFACDQGFKSKEQVDKSCTSGLPVGLPVGTIKAPSSLASYEKSGSLCDIKHTKETSLLHLRNIILAFDYFLLSSPPDYALKHRSQEVRMLNDISLHSAYAATY